MTHTLGVFGGVLLGLGVLALVATLDIAGWSPSGPRLAPAVSAVALIVLSAAFLVWPGAGYADHVAEASAGTHWPTPVLLVGLLLGYVLLLTALGYALATTIFFWLTAWLLGSDRAGRDVVIGAVLGIVTSYAFTQLLNVQLPTGPWGVSTALFAANLLDGFAAVLTPQNLLLAALGVSLGTLIGVLPGIGPALTIALLLPITFNFEDPVGAFILFAGIYAGGMYGGSTTSILLNTPGESASVATAIEGFEMAKRGRGRAALATAAIGSFAAGTIGIVALTLVAEPVASLAVKFRAEDYFALTLLAFASVTALTSKSLIRGFCSLSVGLLIGFVGIDELTGQSRLSFGVDQLGSGIDIVIVAVGLIAVGEALHMASKLRSGGADEVMQPEEASGHWLSRGDFGRSWRPWLRGAAIGFPFGALPAGGAEVPTFLSYATEKKLGGDKEWGEGAIEGVAGPEAANNASFSGTLVPLGIPTSATAAIMLAAFQIFNLQPGPELFEKNSELVWTLIASLYVGNVMLLLLNLPLIRIWVKVLEVPRPLLYAGILVFGTLGVYSLSSSVTEVVVMYAIGVLGFFMRRYDFPIAPVILGVILGPLISDED